MQNHRLQRLIISLATDIVVALLAILHSLLTPFDTLSRTQRKTKLRILRVARTNGEDTVDGSPYNITQQLCRLKSLRLMRG